MQHGAAAQPELRRGNLAAIAQDRHRAAKPVTALPRRSLQQPPRPACAKDVRPARASELLALPADQCRKILARRGTERHSLGPKVFLALACKAPHFLDVHGMRFSLCFAPRIEAATQIRNSRALARARLHAAQPRRSCPAAERIGRNACPSERL